jgi:transposase, IS5 family
MEYRLPLGRAPVPDGMTILNFRHLLEEHELYGQMLDTVNVYLESTIVDATIIHARSPTKNQDKERDPDMHQTRKAISECVRSACPRFAAYS